MLALHTTATALGSIVPAHRLKPVAEAHRCFLDKPTDMSLCERYCIERAKLDAPRGRAC